MFALLLSHYRPLDEAMTCYISTNHVLTAGLRYSAYHDVLVCSMHVLLISDLRHQEKAQTWYLSPHHVHITVCTLLPTGREVIQHSRTCHV